MLKSFFDPAWFKAVLKLSKTVSKFLLKKLSTYATVR